MVTIICSIISTLVIIFFFVHNIILQVKVRNLEKRVEIWYHNAYLGVLQEYKDGKITEEEMKEELEFINKYEQYIIDGKA